MPAGRGAGSPGLSTRRPLAPVALATHAASPEATDDDRILLDRLAERYEGGAEAVAWDAPAADWGRYAAVLLRSTWNCHLQPDAFLAWVLRVEAAGASLWNPGPVVRWNLEKGYLRDIAAAGIPVVPTEWIPRGGEPALSTVLRCRGWETAVVKPSIAATAFRTWRTTPADAGAHSARLAALLAEADAMVQPFLAEVQQEGEWSFVFLGDGAGPPTFSHAVVKRPARWDFRVQPQFGGTVYSADPPRPLLRQAERAAAAVTRLAPGSLLYARIDGVVSEGAHAPPGTFLLMEAELIEPVLFLGRDEEAAPRLADAVARWLAGAGRDPGARGRAGRGAAAIGRVARG
jgi:hypothetical protein